MRQRPDSEAVLVLPPTVRRARRARARRRWSTIGLFLAPALALYALLVIAPVLQAMYYSAFDWSGLGPLDDFVGLENFKRAFNDEVFIGALEHNGIFIVLSLTLQLPFALGVALLLNARIHGRALLRVLYFAPFVLSEVVTGVVFTLMLQPGGLVDSVSPVDRLWLADPNIVLYTLFVTISWKYFGFHMILYLAGPAADPARARGGGADRRRHALARLPLRDAAAARARRSGSPRSCRSSAHSSSSTSCG